MVAIYFDVRPKKKRGDLYDREKELKEFEKSLKSGNPLTVITGIRRLGKTSLLMVGLNELGIPYVLVDFRRVNPNSQRDICKRIESSLNGFFRENRGLWEELKNDLRNIAGLWFLNLGWVFPGRMRKLTYSALP